MRCSSASVAGAVCRWLSKGCIEYKLAQLQQDVVHGKFNCTWYPHTQWSAWNIPTIKDDIMVVGYKPDHGDQNQAFTSLLQTAQKCNVKLKLWQVAVQEEWGRFLWWDLYYSGSKPVQSKVSAITAIPSPPKKKQVQSFIGKINYLSKFSLRLSELSEPVWELLKDKVPFNWGPEQAAFTKIKHKISSAPVLAYYNPRSKLCCR